MTDDIKDGGQPPANDLPEDETVETAVEKVAPEEGANIVLTRAFWPVTENGEVNIGMAGSIHLPSEAQQRAGFKLEEKDLGVFLQQYQGRYKAFSSDKSKTPGGQSNAK